VASYACAVTHYSRLYKVVIDVPPADHERELGFWSAATGQSLAHFDRYPEYHGSALHGLDFWLLTQRLDDGQARLHLDIHTDDLAAEVLRLEKLGAERVRQVHAWQIMRDPAGLLFCVIPEPPGSLNDSNARRWD
jgi:Glyoxalase-like domain